MGGVYKGAQIREQGHWHFFHFAAVSGATASSQNIVSPSSSLIKVMTYKMDHTVSPDPCKCAHQHSTANATVAQKKGVKPAWQVYSVVLVFSLSGTQGSGSRELKEKLQRAT